MASIQKLPITVVNQIAAGEVIERPASVVKELLENALDAGAKRIEVMIEQGGRDLIRVRDDGCGISDRDLALAVAPHATSKLSSAEDLFRVATYGFRGEALASIASVSHLAVESCPIGELAGARIEVRGGAAGDPVSKGCPEGTTIEVSNLFFNVPVRRRYMKSVQTELGHIVEAFTRIAVARPNTALALRHNGRTLFDLPAAEDLLTRLAMFFGNGLAEKLIPIDSDRCGRQLYGYVADPTETRSNSRLQYIYVNGRFIRDRSLSHALGEAYRGLLMVGRYPIAFLFIEVEPQEVDVNIHPTKIEVRFRDPHQFYSLILGSLRETFLHSDLTAQLKAPAPVVPPQEPQVRHDTGVRQSLEAYFGGPHDPKPVSPAHPRPGAAAGPFRLDVPASPAPQGHLPFQAPAPSAPAPASPQTGPVSAPTVAADSSSTPCNAIQVHQAYLVLETEEGMMVIDQHALHERILYEQLRERVLSGQLEVQRLLVPEPVELSAADAALVLGSQDLLAELGLEVEPFGPTAVALQTMPALIRRAAPGRILRDVVDQLVARGRSPDRRDMIDKLLHSMSCKAAVKAGQRLTPEEIRWLASQRALAHDSHHCPHGRPTALVFTRHELEKQFKRI